MPLIQHTPEFLEKQRKRKISKEKAARLDAFVIEQRKLQQTKIEADTEKLRKENEFRKISQALENGDKLELQHLSLEECQIIQEEQFGLFNLLQKLFVNRFIKNLKKQ